MLGALLDYARDHELVAEPGFAPKVVRWALVCDADGRFLEVLDLAVEGSRGRPFRRCPELSQPEMKRGGSGCRHFLVDSADALHATRALVEREGVFAGISSGAVLHVANRIAQDLEEGDIVCLLADGGWKYLSTNAWAEELDRAEKGVEETLWW